MTDATAKSEDTDTKIQQGYQEEWDATGCDTSLVVDGRLCCLCLHSGYILHTKNRILDDHQHKPLTRSVTCLNVTEIDMKRKVIKNR